VVLDLGLPGVGGLEVLQQIQAEGDTPVVVLTGRHEETDRVLGLELGADDYVAKPFSPRELAARVRSVLRRSSMRRPPSVLDFGDLVVDAAAREVLVDGKPRTLTPKEFALLEFLASSPRQVFNRAQLLRHVWNSAPEWQNEATVSEHIHRIRRKIEKDPQRPRWVTTVRNTGYRFEP
jgi:DNA-binding response OmpR family regulator